MRVLFSIADWELVTRYLAAHAQQLIDHAINKNHDVFYLYDDNQTNPARRLFFEQELNQKPDIVIGMGHGGQRIFTGQDNEVLLEKDVNDQLMSGAKSYMWSCLTGRELGPSCVEKTCPLYIGYTLDWTFIYHPQYQNTPLDDPWAKAFFDSGLVPAYGLLDGKAPQVIYEETKERYNYWYDYWMEQNDPMADDIMTWLNWNKHALTVLTPEGIYGGTAGGLDNLGMLATAGIAGVALFFMLKG